MPERPTQADLARWCLGAAARWYEEADRAARWLPREVVASRERWSASEPALWFRWYWELIDRIHELAQEGVHV